MGHIHNDQQKILEQYDAKIHKDAIYIQKMHFKGDILMIKIILNIFFSPNFILIIKISLVNISNQEYFSENNDLLKSVF